jgi:hypothetical protein
MPKAGYTKKTVLVACVLVLLEGSSSSTELLNRTKCAYLSRQVDAIIRFNADTLDLSFIITSIIVIIIRIIDSLASMQKGA